jgi:hypothetical protein
LKTVEDVAKMRGKTTEEVRRGSVLGAMPSINEAPIAAPAVVAEIKAVNAVEDAFAVSAEETSNG